LGIAHGFALWAKSQAMSAIATLYVGLRQPRKGALALKRFADIALAFLGIAALTPLMVILAVLIYIESPGTILYISERIGKDGVTFRFFKFRTMVKGADKLKTQLEALNERDAVFFKLSNDPRVTRVGGFLRKYSLDELPQLLNVLRGEMSLVGPRPPLASEVEKYKPEHLIRFAVLPGLTGLWQVESRADPSFAKYIAMDTRYVHDWSLWLDMKILLRTPGVVLRGTGS
jgi:lipopolysaccharide/colanic/teichoic acid biosynthesis glycosyltransferase